MRLILTADVQELGKRGDVVDVAEGYARNYLLPRKKAVKAHEAALAQAEAVREARIEAERKAKEEAERLATQLVGSRVVIAAQAGDEGQLYGSISAADVVEGVRRFTGIELDRDSLEIPKP
ncbi:MAG: 50S ribosomal protein L9, partial [Acidimicrobiia bacterium]